MKTLNDPRALATVLAALRYWQREGLASAGHEQDIATDSGSLAPMSAEEIDDLCESINVADPEVPAVVVEVEGGLVQCVRSSAPVRVVILDADTEGGDADRIHEVNGEDTYVHDYALNKFEGDGYDGVAPEFVADVLKQLEALEEA